MSFEDDLRITLRDRASETMPPADLLTETNKGVRRDQRRRRWLATGVAVVAAGAILAVPLAIRGDGGLSPRLPAAPVTSLPDVAGLGPWEPIVTFDLRPGWVPDGVGPPTLELMGPNQVLRYEKDTQILAAEFGPLEPEWEVEATAESSTTIGDRPAIVHTADDYDGAAPGHRYVAVRWKTAEDKWVQVTSLAPYSEEAVLRFARELGSEPGVVPPVPPTFTFAEHMAGMAPQYVGPTMVCQVPQEMSGRQRQPEGLCVYTLEEKFAPGPHGERLLIGGRPAYLYLDGGIFDIDLSGGRTLRIEWDQQTIPLGRERILRFAAGITYRG
ncbi:hypothetical protein FHR83_001599 [Actinoplanes campanulatus]|uniref:Uncharacterized protein n=1 Tax=Actinoplanes campanulatus TaxID=113559 RepID=A0A7W5ADF7_9ACTN|nr:hypothetical protein [Actinoplanes campanulatus]MBB3093950.1 hypothetical protein [Actinoplanes campanulatus]GGN33611.1 hypothetical protein GCM10010109_55790 [Actinoplanes campanulatus]GID38354.1 hypothetical protein Aca09nite_48600 [Actinoplanes campanulatus]